jgi:hypothetical protein
VEEKLVPPKNKFQKERKKISQENKDWAQASGRRTNNCHSASISSFFPPFFFFSSASNCCI